MVAGGEVEDRTRVLDVGSRTWMEGPALPQENGLGAVMQTEDSFLIIGGYTLNAARDVIYYDSILEFDPTAEEWMVRSGTLEVSRSDFFMISVDKNNIWADIYCVFEVGKQKITVLYP